mgnify:CR=1 FL=1
MLKLDGKYGSAKVFTNNIDNETVSQIIQLLNQPFVKESRIRVMPDCHAGKGCVIGFTADLGEKVIPSLVGVDIGCGVITVKLGNINIDLEKLDDVINSFIPSGYSVHENKVASFQGLKNLHCYERIKDKERIERSIGTLGGGNHFIEVNKDKNGEKYIVVHTGSRNLGHQVANYYQDKAVEQCKGRNEYLKERGTLIKEYKKSGRQREISAELLKLEEIYKKAHPDYPEDLCFLTGESKRAYLHDMEICQEYASLNRETIMNIILEEMFNMDLGNYEYFHTVHNYINFKDNIIRKGAISAYENERLLIPINMRDGSILAVGKGNPDWNYSAPHGAGRIMSRNVAKNNISLEEFQESMRGIYTTSVKKSTIDEAPMAYKKIDEIIKNTKDTIKIIDIIKPIYNFKAH